MARIPGLGRFRRRNDEQAPAAAAEEPAATPLPRRAAPSPGALRRERRAILREREERIRDIGGLALEMVRQDRFRDDLLVEHCHEVLGLEARLYELDAMLTASATARRTPSGRCECGAPVVWGSHFCANCGRPVGESPVVACPDCAHPLPADAKFCAGCGRAAALEVEEAGDAGAAYEASSPNGGAGEATMLRAPDELAGEHASAERGSDPWER